MTGVIPHDSSSVTSSGESLVRAICVQYATMRLTVENNNPHRPSHKAGVTLGLVGLPIDKHIGPFGATGQVDPCSV